MSKHKSHHHHICHLCEAQCCQYYALEIDTPRSYADFDQIKWFLAHRQTKIFVEKRKWYLEVLNPCRYLSEDHKCTVYDKRPAICRDYGIAPDGEMNCHGKDNHEVAHDLYFDKMEDIDVYLKKRFSRPKRKKVKT